ncbi:MAG: protein kinase domain-containing protein [Gammaproteobacteria bacterium]
MAEPRHAALPPGYVLEQFHITELLGQGGFGITYKAIDTRLQRTVAIKEYLPRHFAYRGDDSTVLPREDDDRETFAWGLKRFIDEARALARFRHPNIVAVMQFLEANGTAYLVMEYEEGRNLEAWLALHPQGADEDVLVDGILLPLLDGLEKVHEKGLLHRDIKPENVFMRRDGTPVLIDFGASRPHGKAATATLTSLISVGYTPFEQYGGAGRQGPWTDLYALAGTMYRVIAGQKPPDAIARQQGEVLTPAAEAGRGRYGETFLSAIDRALALDPAERPQSAAEFRAMVRGGTADKDATFIRRGPGVRSAAEGWLGHRSLRWAPGAAGALVVAGIIALTQPGLRERLFARFEPSGATEAEPAKQAIAVADNSIAVLPLANLSGDPEQAYFVDGMHEALISTLAGISALRVTSATSANQYRDTRKNISQIGRELGVAMLVEGSVYRVENAVRITLQLIEAGADENLWAESYERKLEDVLALQRSVARAVADEIAVELTQQEESRLASTRTVNPQMYDAYLKGMFHLRQVTSEGTEKGLDYLQQAVGIDPADPLPWAGLAIGYSLAAHGPTGGPEAFEQAKAAAARALELDDTLAEAQAALAQIKLYQDWDWEGARQAFESALRYNPSLAETRAHYSWYLQLMGRTAEGLAEMRRAEEFDPLTPLWSAWLGWQQWDAHEFDAAIREAQESLELMPDFPVGLYVLGSAYASKGMFEQAIATHERLNAVSSVWRFALARTYAMAGRREDSRRKLAEIEADPTKWDMYFLAAIHASLGDEEKALRWLEKACEEPHHPYAPWMSRATLFETLRSEPRFEALLEKMSL